MGVDRRIVLNLVLGMLSGQGTAQSQDHSSHHPPHALPGTHPPPTVSPFTVDMDQAMDRMMRDMHGMHRTGRADIDFLTMMIPHHAGAIEMARLVLRDGSDPQVREIAEMIIATQTAEIEGMRGRLAFLERGEPAFPMLTGNRGDADPKRE